ncbi:MAG: molybdenum cofactor guanylyltransferase [Chroococcidiopsidaceae cyanobacterium CP_BM_RX_35]|nr:molybdenum cofactor guanylyltransferase [Chroococcidiopsidaceae cyanobacterium CP_BM_RX_35]
MVNSASLSAIVLAGGRSSRMGQDKALLPIQGVPMLQLVCEVAQNCTSSVYVVTPWPERYQHLLPATCQLLQEVPLPGESTGEVLSSSSKATLPLPHGPLIGFAQGLAQVQTDWVLLLACDLPRLRVEILQRWADGLPSVSQDAFALLPRHAKGWEPLCGFYRCSCLPTLTDFIQQGGRSFQQWLIQHSVQLLPLPEDDPMLFNCNTSADLAAINCLESPTKER